MRARATKPKRHKPQVVVTMTFEEAAALVSNYDELDPVDCTAEERVLCHQLRVAMAAYRAHRRQPRLDTRTHDHTGRDCLQCRDLTRDHGRVV